MLSTKIRLMLQEIANKIENQQTVSLEEMILAEKWAKSNRSAAEILRKARRISIQGKGQPDSLDEFLQAMDLGDPDPSNHKTGQMSPDDLADFFRNDNDEEWLKRD
jgi:hypothetical protein